MKTLLLALAAIIPFERDVPRVQQYAYTTFNNEQSNYYQTKFGADSNELLYYRGFDFSNMGPNEIVPTTPLEYYYPRRDFDFITDDHSKRDNYLWLTDDVGSGRISDLMETVMVFLPRKNQMSIEEQDHTLKITLVTGEEVLFDKIKKTILSGVLTERKIDLNPDRMQRKFADVTYHGAGVVIRSDARGADPRLTERSQVLKAGLPPCSIGTSLFWTESGFPKFRFIDDEEAYKIIRAHCGAQYAPQ